jgi:3D (Asp-Asp-Asp) domain-containing protein
MKKSLSNRLKNNFKVGLLLIFTLSFNINPKVDELKVNNLNIDKTIELEHKPIAFQTIEQKKYNLPLFTSKILTNGEEGVTASTPSGNESIQIKEPVNQIVAVGTGNPGSFVGIMTGYGPDCVGCGGRVSCQPRPNVQNGNIYFEDATYGKVRIVAADSNIPCGTMMKISNTIQSAEPMIAIVLDRGGAIKGKKIDLLFESESTAGPTERNVVFDIVRWGW